MEWWRRRLKISSAVDPIEANALRGGRLSMRDSVVVSQPDPDLERLRRLGRPRGRLHPDRLGRRLAARQVLRSPPQRSAPDRRLRRGRRDRGGLRRADHRRVLRLRADRRRLFGRQRRADPGRLARGRADRAMARRRALSHRDPEGRRRRRRAISGADRARAVVSGVGIAVMRGFARCSSACWQQAAGLAAPGRSAASSSAASRSSRRRCWRPATAPWCSTSSATWRSA